MNWFYNLKLRTKLLSGFLTVVLVAVMIGFVGPKNIHRSNSADPANGPGQKIRSFTGSAGVPCYAYCRRTI